MKQFNVNTILTMGLGALITYCQFLNSRNQAQIDSKFGSIMPKEEIMVRLNAIESRQDDARSKMMLVERDLIDFRLELARLKQDIQRKP